MKGIPCISGTFLYLTLKNIYLFDFNGRTDIKSQSSQNTGGCPLKRKHFDPHMSETLAGHAYKYIS